MKPAGRSGTARLVLTAWVLEALAPLAVVHAQTQPAPQARQASPFQRSRLTRDESEATADRRDILLTIGEDYTLDLDFEPEWDRIVIGNPTLVGTTNVKQKRQIIIKPLKDGETTIQLRDPEGNLRLVLDVSITRSNLRRRASEIRELLREVEGVRVRVVGQRVVVDGEVLVPNDYSQVLNVLRDRAYAEIVINQVRLSPVGLQLLASRIEEELHKFAPNVTTRVVNNIILVEGTVDSDEKIQLVERTVNLYAPAVLPGIPPALGGDTGVRTRPPEQIQWVDIRVTVEEPPPPPPDPNAVPPGTPPEPAEPRQVRITAHFVELSKDYAKVFGFKWQPGFTADPQITVGAGAGGQAAAGGTSFTGTISSLFPKLRTAQFAGYARVLKTATVVTRDDSGAAVEQVAQVPVVMIGQGGIANQGPPVNVAFSLKVRPKITEGTNSLMLTVTDFSQTSVIGKTAQQMPIVSVNRVSTSFFMNSGDSAAIAALNTTDIGTDFNKDDPRQQGPGQDRTGLGMMGDDGRPAPPIEPLFTLLSSKAYRKKKSQVVVFITPEIITNPASATEDLKKNFRIRVK